MRGLLAEPNETSKPFLSNGIMPKLHLERDVSGHTAHEIVLAREGNAVYAC